MHTKPHKVAAATALLALMCLQGTAQAHHPTGGAMPTTFAHGLLSGIGHPIIGPDHLAFVVGIGLLAAISGHGLILPALFVAAMIAGLELHIAGFNLPYAELLLALSVLLIGIALCRPRFGQASWLEAYWLEGGLFALAGLLHGYAFAEAVIGAEASPILAYIIGLAAVQMAIATAAFVLARGGPGVQPMLTPLAVRALGTAIAMVGVTFVVLNARAT